MAKFDPEANMTELLNVDSQESAQEWLKGYKEFHKDNPSWESNIKYMIGYAASERRRKELTQWYFNPKKEVKGLFYSSAEKKLFFIPDYYTNGTGSLSVLRKNLESSERVLRNYSHQGEIQCGEILQSSRYKSMWYFSVDCDYCPAKAFDLGKDWTMMKWIQN